MNEQDFNFIVLDTDIDRAERVTSLVRFLGYNATIASDEESLQALMLATPNLVAMLVAPSGGDTLLACALQAREDRKLGCACYLLADAEEGPSLPEEFREHIQGVIPAGASYRELLGSLQEGIAHYRSGDQGHYATLNRSLVGCSNDIQTVRHLIKQVGEASATVLVTGESGTGKEVVARCIHSVSSRRDGPFVPINCGAIPAELLESELFGHEKGAFTGAVTARQGRFELAKGGTLFLDEIGDMPLDMQVKLLRVLQEQSFERVGSNKTIRADVRIVAATHRNLEQLVAEGKFRMDLFYRLNVFPIEISALRDRASDIPQLIEGYIHKMEREQRMFLHLSDSAMHCLVNYQWPGNVRELFNLLERLAILYPQRVVQWSDLPEKYRVDHEQFAQQSMQEAVVDTDLEPVLPMSLSAVADLPHDGIDLRPHLAGIERSLMTQALRQSEWVVARAAKLLNLQRTTLVEKMRKFEIQRPEGLTGN